MKSLTRPWFNMSGISVRKNDCSFTERLILYELKDPEEKDSPLFLSINMLSGAIDVFEYEEGLLIQRAIQNKQTSILPDQLFCQLTKRGYLFQNRAHEAFFFDTAVKDYKYRKYLNDKIIAFFSIDTACPMGCAYCFERKSEKNSDEFEHSIMDTESIKAAFEFLLMIQSTQGRLDFVAAWGGEPLQGKHYQVIQLFMRMASQYNLPMAYFSNLAFIDEALSDLLAEYADKIKFLQTTIDGLHQDHDRYRSTPNAFSKTVAHIDQLLKKNIPVIVRTNLGAHNINNLPEIVKFYHEQGWFEYPRFKCFVTHTYDRHHIFKENMTLSENEAYSKYLEFRDQYPLMRKVQGIKFGPLLYLKSSGICIHRSTELLPVYMGGMYWITQI